MQMATDKQKALLESKGVSDGELTGLTKEDASNKINELLMKQGNGHGFGANG